MSNIQCYNLKRRFSKGLFAAVLLLSIFTFSGFVAQTSTVNNKPQTILVAKSQGRFVKGISYSRVVKEAAHKTVTFYSFVELSRLHSNQVKIQIAVLSNRSMPTPGGLFYRVKTIPQNPGDEPAIRLG
jgi:hypothetical protein